MYSTDAVILLPTSRSNGRFSISRHNERLAVNAPSCVRDSDSDSVFSGHLQLVYSVAGVSETATSPLTSTTAGLSPHHL